MAVADLPLPPARALVTADEYVYRGSRRAGPSGRWSFQLRNNGEDDHDLRIRRSDGTVIADAGIVHPNAVGGIRIRLRPGRYTLFCSLGDHEARGMTWGLIVRVPTVRTTAP